MSEPCRASGHPVPGRGPFDNGRSGRAGGCRLGRQPERVTLREVIDTASGPIRLMDCVDMPEACEHSPTCRSRNAWLPLTTDMRGVRRTAAPDRR